MRVDSPEVYTWCDSHCHLDAAEFRADFDAVMHRSVAFGVRQWIVPAVSTSAFESVHAIAQRYEGADYALGIHPLYVQSAKASHIDLLESWIVRLRSDEKLIAVGEIGLDLYPGHPPFDLQQWFFEQQLRLARRYDLAVIVHARRAPDQVFAGLRRFNIKRGIVHAFNGSEQQAHALIGQGMFLGFGGSLTYQGSRRIRRLAQVLPLSSMLLETDAPDIKPSWFASTPERPNEPSQLAAIADCLAKLRGQTLQALSDTFADNLQRFKRKL
ncbi:MAG: TatD family hydrolase [Burkholderiales bacterium]|jgi:TatD DNase family protein